MNVTLKQIENPYKNWKNSISEGSNEKIFSDLIFVRKKGYGPDYHPQFLPMDIVDFFASHYLFYLEEEPVASLRQLEQSLCHYHELELPLTKIVNEAGTPEHKEAYHHLLSSFDRVNYSSSLTIVKEKRSPELNKICKEIMCALLLDDILTHPGTIVVGGSVIKYNTHHTFAKWGYKFLSRDDKILPPILKKSAREEIQVAYSSTPSEYSLSCLEKHQKLINQSKKECMDRNKERSLLNEGLCLRG